MAGFSVLISVYCKENHHFLYDALFSIVHQTLTPSEIVIVKDGPLGEDLEEVISLFSSKYSSIKVVGLPYNQGLGAALKIGLQHCRYEYVARMDADDISLPNRFEKQYNFLKTYQDVAVLGSNLSEFELVPKDIKSNRILPEKHSDIVRFSKFRCPINHPTVMFRKSAILDCGSYQDNFPEDYHLWIKMISKGYKFHNIQDKLLYFRRGNMIEKRKGLSYSRQEARLFYAAYKIKHLNLAELLLNVIVKVPVRLLPSLMLTSFYTLFLRSRSA